MFVGEVMGRGRGQTEERGVKGKDGKNERERGNGGTGSIKGNVGMITFWCGNV